MRKGTKAPVAAVSVPSRRLPDLRDIQVGEKPMEMNVAQRMMMLVLVGLGLGGCDSGIAYEHATVHGKVTYKGKPLPLGSVLFVPVEPPKEGLMQPASGTIHPDGTYALKSQSEAGAIVGEHKVVVTAVEGQSAGPETSKKEDKDNGPAPAPAAKSVKFKTLIPKKYSDPTTTPLPRTSGSSGNRDGRAKKKGRSVPGLPTNLIKKAFCSGVR